MTWWLATGDDDEDGTLAAKQAIIDREAMSVLVNMTQANAAAFACVLAEMIDSLIGSKEWESVEPFHTTALSIATSRALAVSLGATEYDLDELVDFMDERAARSLEAANKIREEDDKQ